MAVCDRSGRCCVIRGVVCPLLDGGLCSVWGEWDSEPYLSSDAAAFMRLFGDYTCADWPQNIPEAMASPSGKCCWQGSD